MNKYGFTLVEMLACLELLGIVLCLGLIVNRGTLSTSMTQLEKTSDNEVYDAVRKYVL